MASFKNCKTPEAAAKQLDETLDKLVHYDGNSYKPLVCFCCDKLLFHEEENMIYTLEKLKKNLICLYQTIMFLVVFMANVIMLLTIYYHTTAIQEKETATG